MKKEILLILLGILLLTACVKDNKKALEFKEEYESLNGVVNKSGKEHRIVTIDGIL